jgi:hypothetical protein
MNPLSSKRPVHEGSEPNRLEFGISILTQWKWDRLSPSPSPAALKRKTNEVAPRAGRERQRDRETEREWHGICMIEEN